MVRVKHVLPVACLALLSFSSPSSALTCAKNSAAEVVSRLVKSGAKPVVVQGFPIEIIEGPKTSILDSLNKNPNRLRKRNDFVTYDILGTFLGQTDNPVRKIKVTFERICVLNWCGRDAQKFKSRLFILQKQNGNLKGAFGPCGGSTYPVPKLAERRAIDACLLDGNCERQK